MEFNLKTGNQSRIMKKQHIHPLLLGFFAAILLAFLSGCNSANVSEPSTTMGPAPMGGDSPPPRSTFSKLNTRVSASASSNQFSALAQQVEDRVSSSLIARNFNITSGDPDILVELDINASEFDRSGNYVVYEGVVNASVTRTHDYQVIGSNSISAKSPRSLNQNLAISGLGAEISQQAANWVAQSTTPEKLGLSANDITIQLGAFKNPSGYANRFIREVSALDGVTSVILTDQDMSAKKFVFRVVYASNKIPQGILNYISDIESLDIKL